MATRWLPGVVDRELTPGHTAGAHELCPSANVAEEVMVLGDGDQATTMWPRPARLALGRGNQDAETAGGKSGCHFSRRITVEGLNGGGLPLSAAAGIGTWSTLARANAFRPLA